MSVLLSFLGTGITMLFSRIFLKEKPTKKNIIMAVVVAALVGVGFILG
jgi:drug/metabolite transporter (DMT)-like permease